MSSTDARNAAIVIGVANVICSFQPRRITRSTSSIFPESILHSWLTPHYLEHLRNFCTAAIDRPRLAVVHHLNRTPAAACLSCLREDSVHTGELREAESAGIVFPPCMGKQTSNVRCTVVVSESGRWNKCARGGLPTYSRKWLTMYDTTIG